MLKGMSDHLPTVIWRIDCHKLCIDLPAPQHGSKGMPEVHVHRSKLAAFDLLNITMAICPVD